MSRTREDARHDKLRAVKDADAAGLIADSMTVRLAIVARIQSGEITPEEGNAELARVKRNAKRNGLKTRDQVYRES